MNIRVNMKTILLFAGVLITLTVITEARMNKFFAVSLAGLVGAGAMRTYTSAKHPF